MTLPPRQQLEYAHKLYRQAVVATAREIVAAEEDDDLAITFGISDIAGLHRLADATHTALGEFINVAKATLERNTDDQATTRAT